MSLQSVVENRFNGVKSTFARGVPRSIDAVLDALGLQHRRPLSTALAGTGLFLSGVLVGGLAALMFTPKNGKEMRADMERLFESLMTKWRSSEATSEVGATDKAESSGLVTGKHEKHGKDGNQTTGVGRSSPPRHV